MRPHQSASSSAHFLDKHIPALPNVTIEISQGHNGPIPTDIVLECNGARGVANSRERIPQFRQSRQWAKKHGWAEPSVMVVPSLESRDSFLDHHPTPEDIREKLYSKRDLSFEQQRALPRRKRHAAASELERPSNHRNIRESSTDSQHGTTGWISTAECWRYIKPTVIRRPRAKTKAWPSRRSKSRKSTPVRRRESTGGRSSAFVSLPSGIRSENKQQFSKRNRSIGKAVAPGLTSKKSTSSLRKQSYHHCEPRARKDLALSLIPSIHDPLKDRTFSDECREMLKSLEHASDPFVPLAISPSANVASETLPTEHLDPTERKGPEIFLPQALDRLWPPEGAVDGDGSLLSGPIRSSVIMQDETPPSRHLSVKLGSLAGMLHTVQTGSDTLGPVDSDHAGLVNNGRHQATATPLLCLTQPRAVTRLPSARSIMSTDTLAGIEAQVGHEWPGVDPAPKRDATESTPGNTDHRRSGPPPNMPLPALPREAQDEQSDANKSSDDSQSIRLSPGQSSATSVDFACHGMQGPRTDKVRARRLQDLARSRAQSPKLVAQVEAMPRLSKSISAVDAEHPAAVNDILDELDRFPTVPDSRPNSMGSTSIRSAHSRQQSPGKPSALLLRRMSTTSSTVQLTKPQPQVLSQSNIFVVVDSDPLTARFRAGAMSPSQSIDGNSPERRSSVHVAKSSRLREMKVQGLSPVKSSESKTVMPSPNGPPVLTPTWPFGNSKRPSTNESGQQNSSSDERHKYNPTSDSAARKPARFKKRPRWNSVDIDLIRLLQRDLEESYVKVDEQKEKIEWQAHQIQMMTKVLTPMSYIRAVKPPTALQDSPELPPMETETRPVRPATRNSWSNSRDKRQWNIGARSPLSIIEEQTLNIQAHGSLLFANCTSPSAVAGESRSPSKEGIQEGAARRNSILYEPIGLIEDEPDVADSRYYRF